MLTSKLDGHTISDAQHLAGGGLILELNGDADWKSIAQDVQSAIQIDIRFAKFNDGRGYTLATQLRTRLGYRGRLRAVGDLIPDQAQFLKRVGFDEIAPDQLRKRVPHSPYQRNSFHVQTSGR